MVLVERNLKILLPLTDNVVSVIRMLLLIVRAFLDSLVHFKKNLGFLKLLNSLFYC